MVKKKITLLHPSAGAMPGGRQLRRPFSKPELADFASVSTRLIEEEVKLGRLRAIIIGNRTVRFLPEDVDAWLNRRPSIGSKDEEEVPA